MKKYLLILLLFLMLTLTACTKEHTDIKFTDSENFKTLSNVLYPDANYNQEVFNEADMVVKDAFMEFANKTAKILFEKDDNYIYSPISLYIALAMLSEGCLDATYDELAQLLNVTNKDDLRRTLVKIYNTNYYKNNKGEARIANSIWTREEIKPEYLDVLNKNYYASLYYTNFDKTGNQNIVDWINHYTNDLLELTTEKYPVNENTEMMLINTIYFDNKWANDFPKELTFTGEFLGKTTTNVEYMKHTVDTEYGITDSYEVAIDYFENGNTIKYFLPREGYTVDDVLKSDALNKTHKTTKTSCSFIVPKFKYSSEYNLNQTLKDLGVEKIFLPNEANIDFFQTDKLYVTNVKQNATIELNESGVKAAAVTSIGMESTSVGMMMFMNKPFVYTINDANGVMLFAGVVNKIG